MIALEPHHQALYSIQIMSVMSVTIHRGLCTTIPQVTSPGLQFLKEFMPTLKSLEPGTNPTTPFLQPGRQCVCWQPAEFSALAIPLLDMRGKHLQELYHVIDVAWDIAVANSKD